MKGSPKRVTPVNFWVKYKEKVPENIKGLIYDQCYSKETMLFHFHILVFRELFPY